MIRVPLLLWPPGLQPPQPLPQLAAVDTQQSSAEAASAFGGHHEFPRFLLRVRMIHQS